MTYMFLAQGFEEIEAIAVIDILRRAGVDLTTISVSDDKLVTGAHNIPIQADALFSDIDFTKAELLILPGGMPGTTNLGEHQELLQLLRDQNRRGTKIAAICAAPSILGKMHMLRNQQAVCYPGFEQFLDEAFVGKEPVVVSGNITTAKGPGFAMEFGLKLVELLKGEQEAETVAKGMLLL